MLPDINQFAREATETIVNLSNRTANLESQLLGTRNIIRLAETSSPGGVNSITISSIPDDYKYLKLQAYLRSDRAVTDEEVYIRFNADSGNNYDYVYNRFNSAGETQANAFATSAIFCGNIPGANAPAGAFGILDILIGGYANPAGHTSVQSTCSNKIGGAAGNLYHYSAAGWWLSLLDVTSLTILLNTGNIAINSHIDLLGMP